MNVDKKREVMAKFLFSKNETINFKYIKHVSKVGPKTIEIYASGPRKFQWHFDSEEGRDIEYYLIQERLMESSLELAQSIGNKLFKEYEDKTKERFENMSRKQDKQKEN